MVSVYGMSPPFRECLRGIQRISFKGLEDSVPIGKSILGVGLGRTERRYFGIRLPLVLGIRDPPLFFSSFVHYFFFTTVEFPLSFRGVFTNTRFPGLGTG